MDLSLFGSDFSFTEHYFVTNNQGARNRRERQLTRFALPYDYTCFADGTYSIYIELIGFFSRALQEKYVLAKLVKEN